MSRTRLTLAVLACIALGAALRAHDLEGALVWHDEVFTQVFAAGHGADDWLPLFDGEVRPITELRAARVHDPARSALDTARMLARDEPQHPPLYYLAARAFMAAGGGGDVTAAAERLRWLSWFFSILAMVATAWCARELFTRSRARVLAAVGLLAASPFHLFYAQEAREYALWTAFVLASTAALLRARRLGTGKSWLLYAVLLAAGFYTSFAMLTVAVGHGLFVAARELPRWRSEPEAHRALRRAIGAWAVGALLFAPWALLLLAHWEAFEASMAWSRNITVPRSELLETFALNLTRAFAELGVERLTPGAALIGALVALAAVAGLRDLPSEARTLLLALFVAPVCFYLVPDLLTGGIRSLSARYLLPSLLALQLAVAALVGAPRSPPARRRVHALVLTALLGIGALTSLRAARAEAPWTKGISRPLPAIARALSRHRGALVVVDHERHHPGTILTLSGMLPDTTLVQLLPTVEDYELPEQDGPVFLLDVSPRFRDELRASAGVGIEAVVTDRHVSLYRVTAP